MSLPNIHVKVARSQRVRLRAQDLEGKTIEQTESGFIPRVWQHEFDHLNGVLLTDRMGPVARMTHRRTLKELEEKYKRENGK